MILIAMLPQKGSSACKAAQLLSFQMRALEMFYFLGHMLKCLAP